jgi:hypothetical protein
VSPPGAYYDDQAFFKVWCQGVQLAGFRFFGDGSDAPGRIRSKEDLRPRYDDIAANLSVLSSGERAFLVALYSFFNSNTAAKWFQQIGVTGLADLSSSLDEPRRRVIANLLVSYAGW